MKAYISISYRNRKILDHEVQAITSVLDHLNVAHCIFVDQYKFSASQEKEMMMTALSEIDASDFLIAEVTAKGVGIGIEAGYAKARGKKIIYIRNSTAEHSTTISGISDYHLLYTDPKNLRSQLQSIVEKLTARD